MPVIELYSAGFANGPFEYNASWALRRSPFVQVKNFEDIATVESHRNERLNAIMNDKQHGKRESKGERRRKRTLSQKWSDIKA